MARSCSTRTRKTSPRTTAQSGGRSGASASMSARASRDAARSRSSIAACCASRRRADRRRRAQPTRAEPDEPPTSRSRPRRAAARGRLRQRHRAVLVPCAPHEQRTTLRTTRSPRRTRPRARRTACPTLRRAGPARTARAAAVRSRSRSFIRNGEGVEPSSAGSRAPPVLKTGWATGPGPLQADPARAPRSSHRAGAGLTVDDPADRDDDHPGSGNGTVTARRRALAHSADTEYAVCTAGRSNEDARGRRADADGPRGARARPG